MRAYNKKKKEKHESKYRYYICRFSDGYIDKFSCSLSSIRKSFSAYWSERYAKVKFPQDVYNYVSEVIECLKD